MTKIYLRLMTLSFLISLSCSDSDSPESGKINEDGITDIKLLTSVVDDRGGASFAKTIDITYSNDLMQKFDGGGNEYNLEYNLDNKVDIVTDQFDEVLEFTYEGKRLKMILDKYVDSAFNYDENGRIISVIETIEGDNYNQSTYTTYDSKGNVISYRIGPENSEDTSLYTFQFDDKINPFYSLWLKFGFFIDLEVNPYDIMPMNFKHNPIKIFENNVLKFDINYTYDKDGYPLSCGYTKYSSLGESYGTVLFTYL